MFALEFAKVAGHATGPLPLPDSLDELVRERVARLPMELLPLLAAVAAAKASPHPLLLKAVVDNAAALLASAADEGVVTEDSDGAVRFTHPLLESATYLAVPPTARRELHAKLAASNDRFREAALDILRSQLLPLTTRVAEALDEAAAHARARGAPDAAAELARQTIRLTPPADSAQRDERVIGAARYLIDAGQIADARHLLDELLAGPVAGALRARALLDASATEEDFERIGHLAEEALEHADADSVLRVHALLVTSVHRLEQGDIAGGEKIARQALPRRRSWGSGNARSSPGGRRLRVRCQRSSRARSLRARSGAGRCADRRSAGSRARLSHSPSFGCGQESFEKHAGCSRASSRPRTRTRTRITRKSCAGSWSRSSGGRATGTARSVA